MILSYLLAFLARKPGFAWSPALDLSDNELRSVLMPGAQY